MKSLIKCYNVSFTCRNITSTVLIKAEEIHVATAYNENAIKYGTFYLIRTK